MKAAGVVLAAAVLAMAFASAAAAKQFKPGDLRVCVAARCLPIMDQHVLNAVSAFYYGRARPARARSPRRRAPYVELRFRDGYVTGVAAGPRFDRFLSFGVNLDQFAARTWYAIPARAAVAIGLL